MDRIDLTRCTADGDGQCTAPVVGSEVTAGQLAGEPQNRCNRTAAGALEIPKTRTIEGLECRVTHITAYAFDGCTALTSVTIPEGVTDIGIFAFNSCEALTSVTFTGTTPPTFGEHVFFGCTALETIYVPEGSEEDYKNALEGQYTISIDGNKVFCAPMVEALPKPADLPKTGDASMLGAWACLLAIVGVGLMKMRRREA